MKFKFFCYTCKSHLEMDAESKKEASARFMLLGHDDQKVKELPRNIGRKRIYSH